MNKDLIYTLHDLKQYVNSESYDAVEFEEIIEDHGWFAGSSDDSFATDGYDKLIMTEDLSVDVVQITPSNIDRSDIQAYIRNEINQGNSICIDDDSNGGAGLDVVDCRNGEKFIEDLYSFSEPVKIDKTEITWFFREHINLMMGSIDDAYIFKLTKKDYSVLIAVYLI